MEKIILKEFTEFVYNEENQAGDKLEVIYVSDLPEIIKNIIEAINK